MKKVLKISIIVVGIIVFIGILFALYLAYYPHWGRVKEGRWSYNATSATATVTINGNISPEYAGPEFSIASFRIGEVIVTPAVGSFLSTDGTFSFIFPMGVRLEEGRLRGELDLAKNNGKMLFKIPGVFKKVSNLP